MMGIIAKLKNLFAKNNQDIPTESPCGVVVNMTTGESSPVYAISGRKCECGSYGLFDISPDKMRCEGCLNVFDK